MHDQNPIFIPGPTNIPDCLRRAMDIQTRDHRNAAFSEFLVRLLSDLKTVFKTQAGRVMIFPASGTGGWEAAITNTLSPGDKVLAARYGMFSHRWIDLCQRHQFDVEVIDGTWGRGACRPTASPNGWQPTRGTTSRRSSSRTTKQPPAFEATSLPCAGHSMRPSHPAMLYVDGVSSIACMDFCMDEWGVDLAVTGSQKGFMLATGLAIVAASPKALAASESAQSPRCFFDFRDMAKTATTGSYPYTPALQLIVGLRKSLDMLLEEGLESVFARHHRIAEGVRRASQAWGLELCAKSPDLYSETVSTILVPEGFDSNALTSHALQTYDMSFGIGLGDLAGKSFRIGHLGAITDALALCGLATIEMAMKDLKYPIELGSGVAAAQNYYRTTAGLAKKVAA